MPDYYAKIEFISAIIRIYIEKRDDSVHNTGIPFLFSIFVRWITPDQVEIMGLSDKLTPSIWKSIAMELYNHGVNTIIYYRYKNDKKLKKTIFLDKKWLTRYKNSLE